MDISLLFFMTPVIDIIFFNYLYQLMVLVYVGDKIIMSTTKEGLQQEIDHMYDFCEKWKLKDKSNKTKSQFLVIEKVAN